MFNECRHIKNDGKRCHAAALRGKPYCFFHMKFDRIHKRDTIDIPPIEDSTSILLAIGQVVRSLNYETMDCKRAGLMLYGLQIASGVAARREQAEAADTIPDTVRSIHNLAGEPLDFKEAFVFGADMLAPENSVCEPPNDCANCERKSSCDKQTDALQKSPTDQGDDRFTEQQRAVIEVNRYLLAGLREKPLPLCEDNSSELVTIRAEASDDPMGPACHAEAVPKRACHAEAVPKRACHAEAVPKRACHAEANGVGGCPVQVLLGRETRISGIYEDFG